MVRRKRIHSRRIARNWWVQWAPNSFWLGVSNEFEETSFFGFGPVIFIWCPSCGAKEPWK